MKINRGLIRKAILIILVLLIIYSIYYFDSDYKLRINQELGEFKGLQIYEEIHEKYSLKKSPIIDHLKLKTSSNTLTNYNFILDINPHGEIDYLYIGTHINTDNEKRSKIKKVIDYFRNLDDNYPSYFLLKINTENKLSISREVINKKVIDKSEPEIYLDEMLYSLESMPWEGIFQALKSGDYYETYKDYNKHMRIRKVYGENTKFTLEENFNKDKIYFLIDNNKNINKINLDKGFISDSKFVEFVVSFSPKNIGDYPSNVIFLVEIEENLIK